MERYILSNDESSLIQRYRLMSDECKQCFIMLALSAMQYNDATPGNVINFVEYITK